MMGLPKINKKFKHNLKISTKDLQLFSSIYKKREKIKQKVENGGKFLLAVPSTSFLQLDKDAEFINRETQKYLLNLSKNIQKDYALVKSQLNKNKTPLLVLGINTLTVLVASYGVYLFAFKDLPHPRELSTLPIPQTTRIYDRNGHLLYRVYNKANRIKLSWEEIPLIVKQATIAIEDSEYFNHIGVSPKAIIRALLYNIEEKDKSLYQGASTITQQLVKNRLLSPEKTYQRKAREVILSLWAEVLYSKEEILTQYLNEVGYGGPAYGIEAAAQQYFGIPARKLTLSQAAFLAGLTKAPTTFSPFGSNPEMATIRQRQVLSRMKDLNMITEDPYKKALNEKLVFAPQKTNISAPHFVMYVKDQMVEKLGEQLVSEGGLDVTTTVDLEIQTETEEIVKENISKFSDVYNIGSAATLVTNPTTGEILAMVGSADFFDTEKDGFVNVTTSLRQPGSAIKPVNYALAFDQGLTPVSTIDDSPVKFVAKGADPYIPKNYDNRFHGRVTLRSALANSYNIPAVKLLNKVGIENMLEYGRRLGIKSWNGNHPIGLSLTLGGLEVTMLDMARVYGTIANMGKKKELIAIKEIKNSQEEDITAQFYGNKKYLAQEGNLVSEVEAAPADRAISELAAYWLIDILSDSRARIPAFGTNARLDIPGHKIVVKTGTSNSFRDNWTIGFNPEYLVAAWVGNTDGSFMNSHLVSGITGAAPIWNEVMSYLLSGKEPKEFPKPTGLVPVKICATNGLLTCPYCPQEKIEYFTPDKVPTKSCYFKPPEDCQALKDQADAEGKNEEERKQMLWGCAGVN